MFEGAEKKFEIVSKNFDFFSLDDSVFYDWVKSAQTQVLSEIKNDYWKAFLLSESSFFVSQNSVIILTCGITRLIKFLPCFLKSVPSTEIQFLSYERKNEYFPHKQQTCFFEDSKSLESIILGKSYIFGRLDGHHVYLYSSELPIDIDEKQGQTLEILMYNLDAGVRKLFLNANPSKEDVLSELGLNNFFEDCKVDQHHFDPYGYSLNALKGEFYYTIHVTPEKESSYVSFETNDVMKSNLVNSMLLAFKPSCFDTVSFLKNSNLSSDHFEEFSKTQDVRKKLQSGYDVVFKSYEKKEIKPVISKPYLINLKEL